MRHIWGLLVCVGAACLGCGAAASAPSATDIFELTLSGTASAEWDYTTAPVLEGTCTRTERSEGIRKAVFRTRRPTRVRLVDGRIRPADVRSIAGSISLRGAWTTDTRCGDGGPAVIRDCVTTRRTFAGGALRLSSPAAGRLAFGPVRGVRLRKVLCPPEPAAVTRAPLGSVPQSGRLPLGKLTAARTRRVTLTFTFNRTRTFDPPEAGQLEQVAKWKLAFERVKA